MEKNKMSYEEAIKELEQILGDLEREDLPLDTSLEKFKRGLELYNHCSGILKDVEGEIKILLKDDENGLIEEDFSMEV